jgi:hypothetical protein
MGGAEISFWMADHYFSGVARQWADLGPWIVGGGAAGGLTTAGWIAARPGRAPLSRAWP